MEPSHSKYSMAQSMTSFEDIPDASAPTSEMIAHMRRKRNKALKLIHTSHNFYTPPEKRSHKMTKGLLRRSLTKIIQNKDSIDIESITEKEIIRIIQQVSHGAKIFDKEISRKIRSLVTAEIEPKKIEDMIRDMVVKFKKRFEENQLNMFSLKKKIEIVKPEASFEQFVAFLDAIKMENVVKVSATILRKFDPKLLHMHDHVRHQHLSIF